MSKTKTSSKSTKETISISTPSLLSFNGWSASLDITRKTGEPVAHKLRITVPAKLPRDRVAKMGPMFLKCVAAAFTSGLDGQLAVEYA